MGKKIFIHFLLLISNNFILSAIKFWDIFTRNDCYMSLTNPIKYLEIENDFPSAPLYIHVIFKLKVYSNIKNSTLMENEQQYHFIRINESCKILTINIKPFDPRSKIDMVLYTFKYGFAPGCHLILSRYSTFGLILKMEYYGEEYIQGVKSYTITNFNFLQHYANIYREIRLINNNNEMFVMRPIYNGQKPDGFISHIFVVLEDEQKTTISYRFPAFECNSDELNPNDNIIFFDEYPVDVKLTFYTWFRQIQNIADRYIWTSFNLPNIRRDSLNKSYLYQNVIKVFLINEITENEQLHFGMSRVSLKSTNGDIEVLL